MRRAALLKDDRAIPMPTSMNEIVGLPQVLANRSARQIFESSLAEV
jgi:hypothetical protein